RAGGGRGRGALLRRAPRLRRLRPRLRAEPGRARHPAAGRRLSHQAAAAPRQPPRHGRTIMTMEVRLAIGDFAKMTHLSVKALRHYHDVGVLEPVTVDQGSGYRYYAPDQIPLAQVIRRFRDLGMPLDEVKAVLNAPSVAQRNDVIVAHLERMESQLAQTQATVSSLRSLLERPPARIAV